MYAHILIPLENSPADETIIAHIRPLARLMGSRLSLIHVADGHVARNQGALNLEDSQEMREDREYLEKRRAEFERDGFQATATLACGDPASAILAAAEQVKCDLIAMATHGHGFVKDVMLGSVANTVRHRTGTPVLMIRAK